MSSNPRKLSLENFKYLGTNHISRNLSTKIWKEIVLAPSAWHPAMLITIKNCLTNIFFVLLYAF